MNLTTNELIYSIYILIAVEVTIGAYFSNPELNKEKGKLTAIIGSAIMGALWIIWLPFGIALRLLRP